MVKLRRLLSTESVSPQPMRPQRASVARPDQVEAPPPPPQPVAPAVASQSQAVSVDEVELAQVVTAAPERRLSDAANAVPDAAPDLPTIPPPSEDNPTAPRRKKARDWNEETTQTNLVLAPSPKRLYMRKKSLKVLSSAMAFAPHHEHDGEGAGTEGHDIEGASTTQKTNSRSVVEADDSIAIRASQHDQLPARRQINVRPMWQGTVDDFDFEDTENVDLPPDMQKLPEGEADSPDLEGGEETNLKDNLPANWSRPMFKRAGTVGASMVGAVEHAAQTHPQRLTAALIGGGVSFLVVIILIIVIATAGGDDGGGGGSDAAAAAAAANGAAGAGGSEASGSGGSDGSVNGTSGSPGGGSGSTSGGSATTLDPSQTTTTTTTTTTTAAPKISIAEVESHNFPESCWVIVHGKAIDITKWHPIHPGGQNVFLNKCGTDMTASFQAKHGDVNSLLQRILDHPEIILLKGDIDTEGPGAAGVEVVGPVQSALTGVAYDFSAAVPKQAHPGSGSEFKTLVYIDMVGGVDATSMFVNVKDTNQIHTWCDKRPNLSQKIYCTCDTLNTTVTPNICESKWRLWTETELASLEASTSKRKLSPMNATENMLAMTHYLVDENSKSTTGTQTSWLELWEEGLMSIAPGIARFDHTRSHQEVREAAAKGVSTSLEKFASHGWLAKSIFAANNLYCRSGEAVPCDSNVHLMPDGISLLEAGAGANALEVSDSSIGAVGRYRHVTGTGSLQDILDITTRNYVNPFVWSRRRLLEGENSGREQADHDKSRQQEQEKTPVASKAEAFWRKVEVEAKRQRQLAGEQYQESKQVPPAPPHLAEEQDARRERLESCQAPWWQASGQTSDDICSSGAATIRGNLKRIRGDRDRPDRTSGRTNRVLSSATATTTSKAEKFKTLYSNVGLQELLDKEQAIFEGIGVMQTQLANWNTNLNALCPSFPAMGDWADDDSSDAIGMQMRAVAVMLINGVKPKVFQIQTKNYDTHANQNDVLGTIIPDLRTAVYKFVRTGQTCGYMDDVLVSTFSEFGRRLEENSMMGTDHGWGNYFTLFGTGLKSRVFGYENSKASASLTDIIPSQTDSYEVGKGTRGDLLLTTNLATFDACLLDALGLPGLARLGSCPGVMRFRENLNNIPAFNETLYAQIYNLSDVVDYALPPNYIAGNYNASYLTQQNLTRAQVLDLSRRVGLSPNTFDWRTTYIAPTIEKNDTTNLSMQLAIDEILSTENIDTTTKGADIALKQGKAYIGFQNREHVPLKLWTAEARNRTNMWNEILQMPYPRLESVQMRMTRWNITHFFDMTSLNTTSEDPSDPIRTEKVDGTLLLKPEYTGSEGQVLDAIQTVTGAFYRTHPWKSDRNSPWPDLVNYKTDGNAVDADSSGKIDWFRTVQRAMDFSLIKHLTVEQVVDDWACTVNGTHPNDTSVGCDPMCDLRDLITFDYHAKTAYLTDQSETGVCTLTSGLVNDRPCFRLLRNCVVSPSTLKNVWYFRQASLSAAVEDDLHTMFYIDFTDPLKGLRARMTWLWLNFFHAPYAEVNDWTLLGQQYLDIWNHGIGDYRALSKLMFRSAALRVAFDQGEEPECGEAPVENFAREWLERFSVGLRAFGEGDVKKLSKGLSNCKEDYETANLDLTTPGLIFTDPTEIPWTLNDDDADAIVDRILDYRKTVTNYLNQTAITFTTTLPPQAALFLCEKLYREFAVSADDSVAENPKLGTDELQRTPFGEEVISCANYLYNNNYQIKFALEHVFKDETHFFDTLGEKPRHPYAVVLGTIQDWAPTSSAAANGVFDYDDYSSILKRLDQAPWYAHENSGGRWNYVPSRRNFYTSQLLYQTHEEVKTFLTDILEQQWLSTYLTDFATAASFEAAFAPYYHRLGTGSRPSHKKTPAVGETDVGEKYYSMVKYFCGGSWSVEQNAVKEREGTLYLNGIHQDTAVAIEETAVATQYDCELSDTYLWSDVMEMKTEWKRYKRWREAFRACRENVCQFVC